MNRWLLLLIALSASGAHAEAITFRYGWKTGQVWRATHTITRDMRMGDVRDTDGGVARFEYRVVPSGVAGLVKLEATMLSQTTAAGASPFDFSGIRYTAILDQRGAIRGAHYKLGDAEPPALPGVEKDPVAFRQMLRNVAEAWLPAVYWFPELPEKPLEIGEAYERDQSQPIGGTDPGVTMRMVETRTLSLREVDGDRAIFGLTIDSRVDASTAQSSIASSRDAEGTVVFDLGLGMCVRQETHASHRAAFKGATGLEDGQSSAETVTTIEVERVSPAP